MIREHDEASGKPKPPFNPREMLQRMERLLSQTRSPRQKQADEAQRDGGVVVVRPSADR